MPKGNNAIPHVHQRTHWNACSSQKGNFKTFLNQPAQKLRRRRLRLMKAKKVFPRPVKSLRPTVACPTVRYNSKRRLGRGFTMEELKAADLNPRYARTIGINVDGRRKNISEEGLNTNVQRLKTYVSKLVVFPKVGGQGESPKNATQDRTRFGTAAVGSVAKAAADKPRKVTDQEKTNNVYAFLKKNHSAVRFLGARLQRAAKKAAAAKEKSS